MKRIILTESQYDALLNEIRSVIDDSYNGLCEWIYNTIKTNYNNDRFVFIIEVPQEILNKCKTYGTLKSLSIRSDVINYGKMEYKNGVLFVDARNFLNSDKGQVKSRIFHELTHYVNSQNVEIPDILVPEDEEVKRIMYLFRPTECNARINQLYKILEQEKISGKFDNYEYITHLKEMQKLTTRMEQDENLLKSVLSIYKTNGINISLNILKKQWYEYKKKLGKVYNDYSKFN